MQFITKLFFLQLILLPYVVLNLLCNLSLHELHQAQYLSFANLNNFTNVYSLLLRYFYIFQSLHISYFKIKYQFIEIFIYYAFAHRLLKKSFFIIFVQIPIYFLVLSRVPTH
jgi:hypothetical protein